MERERKIVRRKREQKKEKNTHCYLKNYPMYNENKEKLVDFYDSLTLDAISAVSSRRLIKLKVIQSAPFLRKY